MKNYVSIDLGGTNIRVAIVDEKLNIVSALRERSIHGDEDALYEQIKKLLSELIKSYKGEEPLKYVGICAAGFCEDGVLKYSPNLQIHYFDLAGMLRKDFPALKFNLVNDANCSALAEALYGAAKGTKCSFFYTISSGIGCGLINEGKLVDLPFEVGHNYIGYQGRFWDFEQLCSGNGLVHNLSKVNGLEVPDASTFFAKVAQGDKLAHKVYDDWLNLLGASLANTQITYNPEIIILSGGVMKSSALFLEDLKSVAVAFCAPFPVRHLRIAAAFFEQDTGIMGGTAVALAMEKEDK
ncbi:MAG: ROK family protein [Bacilli bacterium]|jgi:glucokinase|nr:ROK family protein [Bacilli bacterium]